MGLQRVTTVHRTVAAVKHSQQDMARMETRRNKWVPTIIICVVVVAIEVIVVDVAAAEQAVHVDDEERTMRSTFDGGSSMKNFVSLQCC